MKSAKSKAEILVRNTRPRDFESIINLTRRVYPASAPWLTEQLASHLAVFPEGQLVAVDAKDSVVGMAASLIVRWDDYKFNETWRDFTDKGMFTNHDPGQGRTLYGAEIMVDPDRRSQGIGSKLYAARRRITERFGLLRIRAGARLRGYWRHAETLRPLQYVEKVVRGELKDPTLSFQLKHGFNVLAVVSGYLSHDPESLGNAALIEWLNPARATTGRTRHIFSAALQLA